MTPDLPASPRFVHLSARGFLAAMLSILVFHQGALWLLVKAGVLPAGVAVWDMATYGPLRVPGIVNSMFWGGLWGIAYAFVAPRLSLSAGLLGGGILFGWLGPLMVTWFVVPAVKGEALMAALDPTWLLAGLLLLGAFGLGIAVFYNALSRRG